MDGSGGVVQVATVDGDGAVRDCAGIWARATARRDRLAQPATVEDTLPGVERRLGLEGARLLLASRDGHPVGFALAAPRPRTLELFYLAVDPDAWGCGVGSKLLLGVEDLARQVDRSTLELWVIDDNERAVEVYERSGWRRTADVHRDAGSGRLERRFLRHLG